MTVEPITVRWNGHLTTESAVEEPDDSLTCGEFVKGFADAHGITGEFSALLDGEPVPDGSPVELLAGETIELRVNAPVEPVEESHGVEIPTADNPADVLVEGNTIAEPPSAEYVAPEPIIDEPDAEPAP